MEELLKLARSALVKHLQGERVKSSEEVMEKYSSKQACFVTLTKKGELRGCIGSLYARRELWKDVLENSINAGFRDTRFLPLRKGELQNIKIEISVLSVPKKVEFRNPEDLLKRINSNYGVILQKGMNSATFLPQVWEQISDKTNFLEQLSIKAGLSKDSWKTADIWVYEVEKVKEE
jgi:AmmeMemoRadiSam system protein A